MQQTKKSFLKNLAGFSTTAWVSFIISFMATPISTRLFPAAELGKVGLFSTYASLFASFCYLGLDQAFVRFFREPPARSSRQGMFTFCIATSLGFSLISSLVMFLGWQSISGLVVGDADLSIFIALAVFSFCLIMFRYLSLTYRMEQNAKLYTIQGVAYALITKVVYLFVGFNSAEGKTAILFLTLLMAVFAGVCIFFQRNRFDVHFAAQVDKPFLRDMAGYAAPLVPLSIITWLNTSISQIALSQLESFGSAGIYQSALGLASTVNIIQTGFNTYWTPYVYENYKNDNKRRFFTVHRLMACLLTLFGLCMALFQAPVFLLLGKAYRESVIFFPFLFLSPICYCLSETTGMGIGISKKTHWNTIVFLASVLTNLGLSLWLIPLMGATGAAIASAAAAIVSLVFRTLVGEKYYKAIYDYRYVAYTVGLTLVASFGNLLLAKQPLPKYILLSGTLLLALVLYRKEIKTLWQTALQVLKEGKKALTRRTSTPTDGGNA